MKKTKSYFKNATLLLITLVMAFVFMYAVAVADSISLKSFILMISISGLWLGLFAKANGYFGLD